jgi:acetolactate synthase-1/2/3 large subunit
MHIVAALDRVAEMRCVLGLFEGVVTGAADGYARMAGKPACTLLHLGPGLANGLANFHNAFRAQVPIVNIVGQHPVSHLRHDAPLTSDIEAIARPYSQWLRTSSAASEIARDASEAIVASRTEPAGIATLIVPADVAWSEGGEIAQTRTSPKAPTPPTETVERAAAMLRSGSRTAMLIGGNGLYGKGLEAAGCIATATNAKLLAPYPFTRLERGAGAAPVERIPYIFEQAVEQLKEFRQMILVGAKIPASYFAHPKRGSVPLAEGCEVYELTGQGQDCAGSLEALAASLSISGARETQSAERPSVPHGEITGSGIAMAVGALLPENAIVVDESMTAGRGLMPATRGVPRHDWLANTGGSIGIAMPLAVGAAVACPNRRILCLSADGSGMYTLQALWTMARESLKVTTVIFANHAYGVLKREFAGLSAGHPGPRAAALFDIGHPNIDWVSLAKGMGVPGVRAVSLDGFVAALREGFESDGPTLIEVEL